MIQVVPKSRQASGDFNGGQIIENKPIGFPQDGGELRPYSNLFYWAYAEALTDSTIGLHPHQGFEIMSFVLKGQIRHYDTNARNWVPLSAGDAQVIRAGNGIQHAEHMHEDSAMFQIWVDPDLGKTLQQEASYDDYPATAFPEVSFSGFRQKTYVGPGAPLRLDTPGLDIYTIEAEPGIFQKEISSEKILSIYLLLGQGKINGQPVAQNDFIRLTSEQLLSVEATDAIRLFVIESPAQLDYRTYAERMWKR
jgi:hypothetical protein